MMTPRNRRSRRRRPMADINVVPYIDVSLVLLLIFMVTAPLLETSVEVELPQANGKAVAASKDTPVIVTLKANGNLFVEVGGRKDAVDKAGLRDKVLAALQGKSGRPVLIRGDQAVAYGEVIRLMATLKKAGVPRVGLMTQPEP